MAVWIFQALSDYLLAERIPALLGKQDDWKASKHHDQLKDGDTAVLWQAGPEGGVYGLGAIKGKPYERDGESRVDVRYDRLLKQPVRRSDLKIHPVLRNLSILSMPRGTVFPVDEVQWNALQKLIAGEKTIQKVTRISFNSANWQRPTGEAAQHEGPETYNHKYGFGHEDWLFRSEWQIDGWRYAFIQGINKSHASLVRANRPFDLTLFTLQPDGRRRYVATILDIECLDDTQASNALDAFKHRGWYDTMVRDIKAVGGDESALGSPEYATWVLNVRFRLDKLRFFPPDTFATATHAIRHFNRYQLYDAEQHVTGRRRGSSEAPTPKGFVRKAVPSVECTPEHARMQEKLMTDLKAEYPGAIVVRERDFIDVTVQTDTTLIFFEIKSDLDPRTVIHLALGQILEYAYHPSRLHALPVRLVIVGRRPLSSEDRDYLDKLKQQFALPLEYRAISL